MKRSTGTCWKYLHKTFFSLFYFCSFSLGGGFWLFTFSSVWVFPVENVGSVTRRVHAWWRGQQTQSLQSLGRGLERTAPSCGARDHCSSGCGKPETSRPTRQHREALEGVCTLPAGKSKWNKAVSLSRLPELGLVWAVDLRDMDLQSHLCCALPRHCEQSN